jgi:hypothetical protein|tara:strand:- start:10 stop:189 length:180 start_codon:yes stop_codon:yes gene_type:complete
MKTSNMVIRVREYEDNTIYTAIEASVADADKAEEIRKNLQKVADLKKDKYIYAVCRLAY